MRGGFWGSSAICWRSLSCNRLVGFGSVREQKGQAESHGQFALEAGAQQGDIAGQQFAAQQRQKVGPECGVGNGKTKVLALHAGIADSQGGQRQKGHIDRFNSNIQAGAGGNLFNIMLGQRLGIALQKPKDRRRHSRQG